MKIISVTPDNVSTEGLFCIKNMKAEGSKKKLEWFMGEFQNGYAFSLPKMSLTRTWLLLNVRLLIKLGDL